MPDYMDHAQALQAESLDHQINAARMKLAGAAALFCEGCDAAIPEERRAAYPSVTRCVHCQEDVEAKAKHYRG